MKLLTEYSPKMDKVLTSEKVSREDKMQGELFQFGLNWTKKYRISPEEYLDMMSKEVETVKKHIETLKK